MSIPPNQFKRDHPWMSFVLLDSSAGPVPSQAKVIHSLMLSLKYMIVMTLSYFFKDNIISGLLLLATGRVLLMSPKGRNASSDGLI